MQVKNSRPELVVLTRTAAYICNMCGDEIPIVHGSKSSSIHEFVVSGGYDSWFPGDMETIRFDLCDRCLRSLCESFKIPPQSTLDTIPITHSETLETYYRQGDRPIVTKSQGDAATLPCPQAEKEMPDGVPYTLQGIFKHFKGNFYEALDIVWIAEEQVWGVLYRALYGDSGYWIRPWTSWNSRTESGQLRFVRV